MIFFALPHPFNQSRWRTNHVWPLQSDYVMHEFADAHHRASARRAFVVKKYINVYLFRKWLMFLLDKTLNPWLGSFRALWSYTETAIWTFNSLIPNWSPINVTFSSKNWITEERQTWTSWMTWGRVNYQAIFILEVNFSCNSRLILFVSYSVSSLWITMFTCCFFYF